MLLALWRRINKGFSFALLIKLSVVYSLDSLHTWPIIQRSKSFVCMYLEFVLTPHKFKGYFWLVYGISATAHVHDVSLRKNTSQGLELQLMYKEGHDSGYAIKDTALKLKAHARSFTKRGTLSIRRLLTALSDQSHSPLHV